MSEISTKGRSRCVARSVTAVFVVTVLILAGCGSKGSSSATGPSAQELTGWAQAVDQAGQHLDQSVSDYGVLVVLVKRATVKNEKDLKAWDKEWKKRQVAYDKQAKEVEAHNAAERQKAAANPTHTMISMPTFRMVYDPSTGLTTIKGEPRPPVTIQGYQPQYRSLPAKPKMPRKVKVKLTGEIKRLKKLEAILSDLEAQFATLVVGSQFAAAVADLQTATADLQAKVAAARAALKKAIKKDKKRGDVVVKKKVTLVDMGGLSASVSALREALLQAAEAAGVSEALTWATGGASASPSPSASASPSP